MKTEELTALGLTKEQADGVFALAGKDIEKYKKRVSDLETERDDLNTRLSTAEDTLKKFDGIDPAAIKQEVETYKKAAKEAEESYTAKLKERDQKDWLDKKLTEYGVKSPYARRQLMSDAMSSDSGLSWKDGAFFGFDDYMKAAHDKDASLYQTAEEKEAAEKKAEQEKKAPSFVGPTGNNGAPETKKYVPPKIF